MAARRPSIAGFRLAVDGDRRGGGRGARDRDRDASRPGSSPAPGVDQLELQQELSSTDVGLLANYHVVEHLDLLENYDVIEHLDELGPGNRQNHETPS